MNKIFIARSYLCIRWRCTILRTATAMRTPGPASSLNEKGVGPAVATGNARPGLTDPKQSGPEVSMASTTYI